MGVESMIELDEAKQKMKEMERKLIELGESL